MCQVLALMGLVSAFLCNNALTQIFLLLFMDKHAEAQRGRELYSRAHSCKWQSFADSNAEPLTPLLGCPQMQSRAGPRGLMRLARERQEGKEPGCHSPLTHLQKPSQIRERLQNTLFQGILSFRHLFSGWGTYRPSSWALPPKPSFSTLRSSRNPLWASLKPSLRQRSKPTCLSYKL